MSDLKAMREAAEAAMASKDFVGWHGAMSDLNAVLHPLNVLALIACAEALGPMIDRWEPDGDADKRMWDRAVAARAQLEAAP